MKDERGYDPMHRLICKSHSSLAQKHHETKKKWGAEFLVRNTEKYCVKIMTLEPDTQCSMHFHEDKEETFVLVSGEMIVETINTKNAERSVTHLVVVGDAVTLKPGTPHTFYCPEGAIQTAVFIEASTEDSPNDSYRIFPSRGKDVDHGRHNN